MKAATILRSKCTIVAVQQTSTAKLVAFIEIFYKIVRVLWVNETKPSCTNAFLVHLFALESQKGSRSEERTIFWDSSRSLDLSLDP